MMNKMGKKEDAALDLHDYPFTLEVLPDHTHSYEPLLLECFQELGNDMRLLDIDRQCVFFLSDSQGNWLEGFAFASQQAPETDLLQMAREQVLRDHHLLRERASTIKLQLATVPLSINDDEQARIYALALLSASDTQRVLGMLGLYTCLHTDDSSISLATAALAIKAKVSQHLTKLLYKYRDRHMFDKDTVQREVLFRIVKEFQAKPDADSILLEVIGNAKKLYPDAQIQLHLSQDNHNSMLPFKLLRFGRDGNKLCNQAYMEGTIQTRLIAGDSVIAAPLSGKQGVYGVLELHTDQDLFDEADVRFISMLADSAGAAFENARLFEQSTLLIQELRLINEMTRQLNQSLQPMDIFKYATKELVKIFAADFGCILKYVEELDKLVVQACNLSALGQADFPTDYGFAGRVFHAKEPLIVSDYANNPQVQSVFMDLSLSRSLLASPIMVKGEVVGVILVSHREPNYFSYDNYKLLQVLCGHIGLALMNASLLAEVRRLAITDRLTGLYARHYLDDQVNQMQRRDHCGSLIVCDIDHFKAVNDTFGHQTGDKILIKVAQIVMDCMEEGAVAARWGGEELAIYLPRVRLEQAFDMAERIRARVERETMPRVTVSCGVSEWVRGTSKISVEHLFYSADMALYEAKHQGRNQVRGGN